MRSFTEIVFYCLFVGSIDVFLPDRFASTVSMLLFILFGHDFLWDFIRVVHDLWQSHQHQVDSISRH